MTRTPIAETTTRTAAPARRTSAATDGALTTIAPGLERTPVRHRAGGPPTARGTRRARCGRMPAAAARAPSRKPSSPPRMRRRPPFFRPAASRYRVGRGRAASRSPSQGIPASRSFRSRSSHAVVSFDPFQLADLAIGEDEVVHDHHVAFPVDPEHQRVRSDRPARSDERAPRGILCGVGSWADRQRHETASRPFTLHDLAPQGAQHHTQISHDLLRKLESLRKPLEPDSDVRSRLALDDFSQQRAHDGDTGPHQQFRQRDGVVDPDPEGHEQHPPDQEGPDSASAWEVFVSPPGGERSAEVSHGDPAQWSAGFEGSAPLARTFDESPRTAPPFVDLAAPPSPFSRSGRMIERRTPRCAGRGGRYGRYPAPTRDKRPNGTARAPGSVAEPGSVRASLARSGRAGLR